MLNPHFTVHLQICDFQTEMKKTLHHMLYKISYPLVFS